MMAWIIQPACISFWVLRKQMRRKGRKGQDQECMQQGYDRSNLHFFRFYFLTQKFRCSAHHQSRNKNRNDDIDIKIQKANSHTSIK